MVGEIILDGKRYQVGAPVKTWEDYNPPLTFVGPPSVFWRRQSPNLVMWHWTAGENAATSTHATLKRRKLGVEFCIERDGTIVQYLDPVLWDPKDIGGRVGHRSISIEVANYGFAMRDQPIPKRGRDRQTDIERLHGVRKRLARFYPAQVTSIAALTKVLCSVIDIPMVFPREPSGDLAFRVLKSRELVAFRGIGGHFHKTIYKFDPGLQIFRDLEYLEVR